MAFGKLKQFFHNERTIEEIKADLRNVSLLRGIGQTQKCEYCGAHCNEKREHHNAYFPTHFFCNKKCHDQWISKIQRKRGWN